MQETPTPAAEAHVVVRSINLQLGEDLRSKAVDRASRLLSANPQIRHIQLTVEQDGSGTGLGPIVAKGEVMFGGPALFTSVTAATPAEALDYLLEKLEHQMRRQRAPRQALLARRPPPTRSAPVAMATVPVGFAARTPQTGAGG